DVVIRRVEVGEVEPRLLRPEREADVGRLVIADVLAHRLDLDQLEVVAVPGGDGTAVRAGVHVPTDLLPVHRRDDDLDSADARLDAGQVLLSASGGHQFVLQYTRPP